MPKPTATDLYAAVVHATDERGTNPATAATRILYLLDAWEAESAAERERGRKALEIVERYADHKPLCDRWTRGERVCNCGFEDAMADFSGVPAQPAPSVSWDYVTASSEEEDVEQANREQRIRRDGYATALLERGITGSKVTAIHLAARRYPLKKRVPKPPIPDPHGYGAWRAEYDDGAKCWHAVWREGEPAASWQADSRYLPMLLTVERIRALAELLNDPWVWVEDSSPEETT